MDEVKNILNQTLKDNDTIVLALSGGPDSMCLLDLLKNIKKNIRIICAHVNHGTRKENKQEYEFIKDYLKKDKIKLEYYEITSYQKGRFTEEEAREKRYQFFNSVYKKYKATYFMSAHHADDLIETILMRMLRGSSLIGYAGILEHSTYQGMNCFRPLLRVNKETILKYLEENNIPYVIDSSNERDDYLRNKIRHHLLPYLQEKENYIEKFLKYSKTLEEADNFIEKKMEKTYPQIVSQGQIQKEKFLELEKEDQYYILKKYFHEIYKERINQVQDKHIILCREFLKNKTHGSISIPGQKKWCVSNQFAYIKENREVKPYKIELKDEIVLPDKSIVKKINSYQSKSNYEIHLNSKSIKLPLYITTRKPGMRMEIKNLNGSKKVNDIFIDKKIVKDNRDEIPIMIDADNTVLWVLGVSKSKYDVLKEEKYDIIYKYEKKEREDYEKKES